MTVFIKFDVLLAKTLESKSRFPRIITSNLGVTMSFIDSFRGWVQFNAYLFMVSAIFLMLHQASPYRIEAFEFKVAWIIDPAFAVRSVTGGSQ